MATTSAPYAAAITPGRAKVLVGLTTTVELVSASRLWSNGMAQNIRYLAMLLDRLPFTQAIYVVPQSVQLNRVAGTRVVSAAEALEHVDILIEIGARIDPILLRRFRARGGKIVSYMCGNAMIMNLESVANGSPGGEIPAAEGFDAAWLTPQHMHTNKSYVMLTRSQYVREVPHIWHPSSLIGGVAEFGNDAFFWKDLPPDGGWRVGVFDPTINVVKTFHIPLLVCEEAYRRDRESVCSVLLFGAQRFIGNAHFAEFVAALDLDHNKKIFAERRHPLPEVLGHHVDAVVTHQWENALNYLYWDVIYSGRPLIHNLPGMDGVGYRYKDFDPADGGRALIEAKARHAERGAATRSKELEVLWRYSIDNPAVQARYSDLLCEVLEVAA